MCLSPCCSFRMSLQGPQWDWYQHTWLEKGATRGILQLEWDHLDHRSCTELAQHLWTLYEDELTSFHLLIQHTISRNWKVREVREWEAKENSTKPSKRFLLFRTRKNSKELERIQRNTEDPIVVLGSRIVFFLFTDLNANICWKCQPQDFTVNFLFCSGHRVRLPNEQPVNPQPPMQTKFYFLFNFIPLYFSPIFQWLTRQVKLWVF